MAALSVAVFAFWRVYAFVLLLPTRPGIFAAELSTIADTPCYQQGAAVCHIVITAASRMRFFVTLECTFYKFVCLSTSFCYVVEV